MIPENIMCVCKKCGSKSYSKFNQNTNSCEKGHPQKTAFLQVGEDTYIFGCKNCSGGQGYDSPFCEGCDSKFERHDAPHEITGGMRPSNYQLLYTIGDIEGAKRYLESIERPTHEESKAVCPHCVDEETSPFKTEREDLEMLGYFTTPPKGGGEYDEHMYAPHGICQNTACIELEYPTNTWAMGVKLILRSELLSDPYSENGVNVLHSGHFCNECEKVTKSILILENRTYTCEDCALEKPDLSANNETNNGPSHVDFAVKSVYSNALKGKNHWLTPPFAFSIAPNFHDRSKSFDKAAKDKAAGSTTPKSNNDWWAVLGPYLRAQHQRKGTESYESQVLLTAYIVKSSMNHIEPLWLYSSKDRTGAGERKIRKAFEHYKNNEIVFSSIIPNVRWASCNPEKNGIESLISVLESNVDFWPIEQSQKQDVVLRANQWCLAFIQSGVYQQYKTTCLLNETYTMNGQLNNPVGMIESFSILAALKEMNPEGKEIVQRHLYPKQETADWSMMLNEKGKRFVTNMEQIINKFNS